MLGNAAGFPGVPYDFIFKAFAVFCQWPLVVNRLKEEWWELGVR